MDDKDTLKQILGKLESLEQGQTEMRTDIGEMRADIGEMRADVTNLKAGQKKLQKDVTAIKRDLKGAWEDIKRLDNRITKQSDELDVLKSRG
jgi:chromosome segregation ATPase